MKEAQPMRIACSFVLSASLLCPSSWQSPVLSAQETKDKPPAQKPETSPLKQPLAFGLEDGTPVKLRLTRNLSSADATTGDRVDFEVLEDIKVKDMIVIPRGGIAWATVTEAQHKRRMARGGKLNVNIDDVRLVDGEKVPLRAVKETKGGGHTGAMTGAIIGTAIVFWPAAPLFLFMHGKDITVPKGHEFTVYSSGGVSLDPVKLAQGAAPNANGAVAGVPGATLSVTSTPAGADIEVDGGYIGSTPSAVPVTLGNHTITVKKQGYSNWERNIRVTGGTVNVGAELT